LKGGFRIYGQLKTRGGGFCGPEGDKLPADRSRQGLSLKRLRTLLFKGRKYKGERGRSRKIHEIREKATPKTGGKLGKSWGKSYGGMGEGCALEKIPKSGREVKKGINRDSGEGEGPRQPWEEGG